jgi:cell division protease FtsH
MVTYYGMSNELPNVSYYDSSESYGFTKPYSEERAESIDKEVQAIIDQEYKRAREILEEYTDGHHQLAQLLLEREVIYTEDAEKIFGKRKWTSRLDILDGEQNVQNTNDNTSTTVASGEETQSDDEDTEEPSDNVPESDTIQPPVFKG